MESKEHDVIKNLGLPEGSRFIRNKENKVVEIRTTDGSFDYTQKGKEFFLGSDVKDSQPKDSSTRIINLEN